MFTKRSKKTLKNSKLINHPWIERMSRVTEMGGEALIEASLNLYSFKRTSVF